MLKAGARLIHRTGWRSIFALLFCINWLAACAPETKVGPIGDSAAARDVLASALEKGPVRAQIFGDPYGLDPARQDVLITSAVADGVQGLKARFSADPTAYGARQPRLVVILNPSTDPPSARACQSPEQIRTAPAQGELVLLAAFCQGDDVINAARAVSEVSGPTDQRLKRMLWQTGGVLFPDDYGHTYGVDLIPGINVGIGGSFGF
ncbi:MAG: hypothetical protein ACR2Q4_17225 [Geminicoccaceae bacterium]